MMNKPYTYVVEKQWCVYYRGDNQGILRLWSNFICRQEFRKLNVQ